MTLSPDCDPGHPVLDISYKWNAETAKLAVAISQTQDTSAGVPVFRLPIKIGITTDTGKRVESTWLTQRSETFEFDVAEQPLMVRFDEGDILLKEWTLEKPISELLYQLDHDNVIGRLWATSELRDHLDDQVVRSALEDAANSDAAEAVRNAAHDILSVD